MNEGEGGWGSEEREEWGGDDDGCDGDDVIQVVIENERIVEE